MKKINANILNDCNVYITTKRILFLYEVEASVMDEGLIYTLDFIKYCTRNEIQIKKIKSIKAIKLAAIRAKKRMAALPSRYLVCLNSNKIFSTSSTSNGSYVSV